MILTEMRLFLFDLLLLGVGWISLKLYRWWTWDRSALPCYFWYQMYQDRYGKWTKTLVEYQGFSDWGWGGNWKLFYWAWLSVPIRAEEFIARCQLSTWCSSHESHKYRGSGWKIEPSWISRVNRKEFEIWRSRYHERRLFYWNIFLEESIWMLDSDEWDKPYDLFGTNIEEFWRAHVFSYWDWFKRFVIEINYCLVENLF